LSALGTQIILVPQWTTWPTARSPIGVSLKPLAIRTLSYTAVHRSNIFAISVFSALSEGGGAGEHVERGLVPFQACAKNVEASCRMSGDLHRAVA
jgi:hypothetical protein